MRDVRKALTEHVGGKPTVPQSMLIDRIVWVSLRLNLFDRQFAESEGKILQDTDQYLAWSNAVSRMLCNPLLQRGTARVLTLEDIL